MEDAEKRINMSSAMPRSSGLLEAGEHGPVMMTEGQIKHVRKLFPETNGRGKRHCVQKALDALEFSQTRVRELEARIAADKSHGKPCYYCGEPINDIDPEA